MSWVFFLASWYMFIALILKLRQITILLFQKSLKRKTFLINCMD